MARARRYEIHINERYHDYWGDDIFEVDEPSSRAGKSSGGERAINDLCHFGDAYTVEQELSRLRENGLIDSDMSFDPSSTEARSGASRPRERHSCAT